MRIVATVLALIGVAFLFVLFPSLMEGVQDAQTDVITNTFNATTAAGVTNVTVTLSQPLFNDDTRHVTAITSDGGGGDNPLPASYTSTTRKLLVTGLDANKTRNLTVQYRTPALADNPGMGTALPLVPTITLLVVIGVIIAVLWTAFHG